MNDFRDHVLLYPLHAIRLSKTFSVQHNDVHRMCVLHFNAQSMSCSLPFITFKSGECRNSATHDRVFMFYFLVVSFIKFVFSDCLHWLSCRTLMMRAIPATKFTLIELYIYCHIQNITPSHTNFRIFSQTSSLRFVIVYIRNALTFSNRPIYDGPLD